MGSGSSTPDSEPSLSLSLSPPEASNRPVEVPNRTTKDIYGKRGQQD